MTYLVFAPSLRYFDAEIRDLFGKEAHRRHQGHWVLDNNDEYLFMADRDRMRGFRGVKVLCWGTMDNLPDIWEIESVERP